MSIAYPQERALPEDQRVQSAEKGGFFSSAASSLWRGLTGGRKLPNQGHYWVVRPKEARSEVATSTSRLDECATLGAEIAAGTTYCDHIQEPKVLAYSDLEHDSEEESSFDQHQQRRYNGADLGAGAS